MKKIICGRIILFREQCPECGEFNLSGNKTFKCTVCETTYTEKRVARIDVLAKNHRRQRMSKKRRICFKLFVELMKSQEGRCHWCNREFGQWYKRKGFVKQLEICGDHKIPWAYCKHNRDENFCLSCNICNGIKSDQMFETEDECRKQVMQKWNKDLENGTMELL